jgi:hypothetical protein
MRYDKLMQFGWKLLFPVALVNALATAAYLGFFPGRPLWPLGLAGLAVLVLGLILDTARSRRPRPVASPLGGD